MSPRWRVSRRTLLGTAAGLAGLVAFGRPRPARAQWRVKIGYIPLLSAGPLFLAEERGYFREAGLDAELVRFNSGAEMVVGLGTGELAAGYGGASPGLMNAWGRGVRILWVADGSRAAPGYGNTQVLVRTDLADSVQTPRDLRGRRVGMSVVGSVIDYVMRNLLEQHGLTLDDVDAVRLPSADVNAGLAGGSLDVAGAGEPFAALAEQTGIARRWLTAEQIVPGMEVAGLLVSGPAASDRAQIVSLTVAYLRGLRDFLPGQVSDPAVVEVLNRWTGVAPDIIRRAVPTYADPNGTLDVEDVRRQQAFWLRHGVVDRAVTIEDFLDLTFAEAAAQMLGRL